MRQVVDSESAFLDALDDSFWDDPANWLPPVWEVRARAGYFIGGKGFATEMGAYRYAAGVELKQELERDALSVPDGYGLIDPDECIKLHNARRTEIFNDRYPGETFKAAIEERAMEIKLRGRGE